MLDGSGNGTNCSSRQLASDHPCFQILPCFWSCFDHFATSEEFDAYLPHFAILVSSWHVKRFDSCVWSCLAIRY